MRLPSAHVSLLALSVVALGACASAAGEEDQSTSDVVVNPVVDDRFGSLKVFADLSQLGAAKIVAQRVGAGGTGNEILVEPNRPQSVRQGKYCLWTRVNGIDTFRNCELVVAADHETVHILGAVKYTRTSDELVFGVDWPTSSGLEPLVALSALVPHASGTFSYGVDPFLSSITVGTSGSPTLVDLSATDGVYSLRILPSSDRQRPNSTGSLFYPLNLTNGRWETLTSKHLQDLAKPLLVRSASSVSSPLALRYWGSMGGPELPSKVVSLTPVTTVVQLGRLDVSKAWESSTSTWLEGAFDVFLDDVEIGYGGRVDAPSLMLGTGLDVLCSPDVGNKPYTVVSRYKLADGTPGQQSEEVFVPCR